MNLTVYILSVVIPYALGARRWVLLLWWLPSAFVLTFLWAYIGKYFLPPKLERCALEPPSIIGLGLK